MRSKFLCRAEAANGGCSTIWEGQPGPASTGCCPNCGSIYFTWMDHPLTIANDTGTQDP